jgi:MinD superfamily P-loop ATPase
MTIAIASGKGGTGKTTVALNLYRWLITEAGKDAILVDCDVEEPNDILFFKDSRPLNESTLFQEIPSIDTTRCTFCRKCVEYCEFNAIVVIPPANFAEISPSLCHSCGACMVACESEAIWVRRESIGSRKYYSPESGDRILEGRLKIGSAMQTMVIRDIKASIPEEVPWVILDAPPGTSCPVVETLSDADYALLVTEPTPFGLHDLKMMIELLRDMGLPFGIIINKAHLGNQDIYRYVEEEGLEILGEIPFSKDYSAKYASGKLFLETPEDVSKSYQKILSTLSEKGVLP